jgi:hypothetical protein
MKVQGLIRGSRRAATRLALVAALGVGGVVATAASASASPPYHTVPGSTAYWLNEVNDSMEVAVANSATYAGAPIIQWYNDGGNEQKWYFDVVEDSSNTPYPYEGFNTVYELRNANSNLCLDTDGTAGDQLVQTTCNPQDYGQWFGQDNTQYGAEFYDIGSGLYLDVSGNSYGAGAAVDEWYWNGNGNQLFYVIQP